MVGLLEQLALSKVKDGDEEAARSVLQEKAAVAEVLGRSQQRAHVNFALAAKLAEKIGGLQRTLMGSLATSAAAPSQRSRSGNTTTTSTTDSSSSTSTSSSTSSSSFASTSADPAGAAPRCPPLAPWEVSLADAQQRIAQAEAAAAAAGATAASSARETIEEARTRLRAQAQASVSQAQERIRTTTGESLAAARARLAAQEAEALSRVRALMGRYRAGEYVSEEELDWAFRVLERRADATSTYH